jgi:hypothetical protein
LNVVAKPHAFDIVHICANGFKFAAEFDTALDHWRGIGELVQITARQLYFELDERIKHRLIVSHYKGSSRNQPQERLCLVQVSDVRNNFEADLVVVETHLSGNLVWNSAEQHLLFIFELFVCLTDHTLSQLFTFADI